MYFLALQFPVTEKLEWYAVCVMKIMQGQTVKGKQRTGMIWTTS